MKMKLKQTLGSISRSLPFSKCLRVVTKMNVIKTSPILTSYVHQPLSVYTFGLIKYITTKATSGESPFITAKTSVWWDIENCRVPKDCDPYKIALNIKTALVEKNYNGPLTIYAYGDTKQITSSVQQALSSTGVSLIHVPPGVKDGSDMKIIVDMLLWLLKNRDLANIMLISGDGGFSYVLNQLRMMIGYDILLARPDNASRRLIGAANTVWSWRSIVFGSFVSEVSKETEPSKRVDSNLVVQSKCSLRVREPLNI